MGGVVNQLCESLASGMSPEDAATTMLTPSRWQRNVFGPATDLQTAYKAFLRGDLSVGEIFYLASDLSSGADALADLASRVSQGYGKAATVDDVPEVGIEPETPDEIPVVIESLQEAERMTTLSPEQQAELEKAYTDRPPEDVKDFWNRFVTPAVSQYEVPEEAEEVEGPDITARADQFLDMVARLQGEGYPEEQAKAIAAKWARQWTPEAAFAAKDEIAARPAPKPSSLAQVDPVRPAPRGSVTPIPDQPLPSVEIGRVRQALMKLGYPKVRAEQAAKKAAASGATDETGLITKALMYLA